MRGRATGLDRNGRARARLERKGYDVPADRVGVANLEKRITADLRRGVRPRTPNVFTELVDWIVAVERKGGPP